MRPPQRLLAWLLCSIAYACGDDGGALDEEGRGLRAEESASSDAPRRVDADPSGLPPSVSDLSVEQLECPHGGQLGRVQVAFRCGEITTVSCKDLSNVVLEFADGSRQRFEGLKGQRGVFAGSGLKDGAVITRVWIKAGSNHSGDGPGYGERFDAPVDSCTKPPVECSVADGSCVPRPPPPPTDDCFVADGSCTPRPPSPPPPVEDDCFVADGSCTPRPPTPPPPSEEPELVI